MSYKNCWRMHKKEKIVLSKHRNCYVWLTVLWKCWYVQLASLLAIPLGYDVWHGKLNLSPAQIDCNPEVTWSKWFCLAISSKLTISLYVSVRKFNSTVFNMRLFIQCYFIWITNFSGLNHTIFKLVCHAFFKIDMYSKQTISSVF